MTRKELKNIKDAWAQSWGYENYKEMIKYVGMNGLEQQDLVDSLLLFSLNNSHKYTK